jgi:hypothetical protein
MVLDAKPRVVEMSLRTPEDENKATLVVGLNYHRTIIVEAMVWISYNVDLCCGA